MTSIQKSPMTAPLPAPSAAPVPAGATAASPAIGQPATTSAAATGLQAAAAAGASRVDVMERSTRETVPADFGAKNGPAISNKSTILTDLWKKLGHDKPPAVALVYVEPLSLIKGWGDSGSGTNPFGHLAIAYTQPNGQTTVMNIVGTGKLVHFVPLEDYLFGTDFDAGSKQGGVYNRHMELVALWDWPADKVASMHQHFEQLAKRNESGKAKFSLIPAYVQNAFNRLFHRAKQWGNCARWTAEGMVAGGLREKDSYWPKKVVLDLLQQHGKDATIIDFPRVKHAKLTYGADADVEGFISPLRTLMGQRLDLDGMAGWRVSVPEGSTRAEIHQAKA